MAAAARRLPMPPEVVSPAEGCSASGLARLFAQRGHEAVREVPANRLFETLEGRLPGSPLWSSEGADVREDPRRGRWSDRCEHGGTHGTGIGTRSRPFDPWWE